MRQITSAYPEFFNTNGSPLNNGYIYIGTENLNPETSPIAVYWDVNATIPAAQPIRTLNGVIVRNGVAADLYTNSVYSLTVKDSNGVLIYSKPSTGSIDAGAVTIPNTIPVAVPYLQTISDIVNGSEVSITRFIDPTLISNIRAGTDNTDLTTQIQNAFNAAKHLYVPWGTYHKSSNVNIVLDGFTLRGDGINATIFMGTGGSTEFTCAASLTGVNLGNFQVTKNVAATSEFGIDFRNTTSFACLHDILVQNCFNGIALASTDKSDAYNIVSQKNVGVGLALQNQQNNTQGTLQWQLDNILCQKNGQQGFLCQSVLGASNPSQITLGKWTRLYTFANSASGLAVIGSATTPINGVRLANSFFGEDGSDEIYINAFGDYHTISDCFTELCGTTATGPTLSTPASHLGHGLLITLNNNTSILITNCVANGHSGTGFRMVGTASSIATINSSRATNNGAAAVAGDTYGIAHLSGGLLVNSSQLGNFGGAAQTYGVFSQASTILSLVGNSFFANATAAWGASASVDSIMAVGNLPNSLNVQLSTTGGAILGLPTGSVSAGKLNVQTGMQVNGTNMTVP